MTKLTRAELSTYILELLEDAEEGMTWKELQVELRDQFNVLKHHGSVSGCLNGLHKEMAVFYIMTKRENCHPYIHAKFRSKYNDDMRRDYPTSNNKWKEVADVLYFVMTADKIPADAWENALELYRKTSNA